MAQLMPLLLTVSCFSKIQIGFTFVVPAHLGSPGQRAVKRVCVWVCMCEDIFSHIRTIQQFIVIICLRTDCLQAGFQYKIQQGQLCTSPFIGNYQEGLLKVQYIHCYIPTTFTYLMPSSYSSDPTFADYCGRLQIIFTYLLCLQCFDAVVWAAGRAPGL